MSWTAFPAYIYLNHHIFLSNFFMKHNMPTSVKRGENDKSSSSGRGQRPGSGWAGQSCSSRGVEKFFFVHEVSYFPLVFQLPCTHIHNIIGRPLPITKSSENFSSTLYNICHVSIVSMMTNFRGILKWWRDIFRVSIFWTVLFPAPFHASRTLLGAPLWEVAALSTLPTPPWPPCLSCLTVAF